MCETRSGDKLTQTLGQFLAVAFLKQADLKMPE